MKTDTQLYKLFSELPGYFFDLTGIHSSAGYTVAPKQRLKKAAEIIERAHTFTISRQHPVVIIGLACLYGNLAAKKLMKFKAAPPNFDAENALADIMLISRFAGIKLEIEQMGRNRTGYPRSDLLPTTMAL